MGKERFKLTACVFLIICKKTNNKKEILLQLRQNTGYMDGYYDLAASGHLEENESLLNAVCEEAKEELNIKIKPENIKLVQVVHDGNSEESLQRIRFFFETSVYEGTPKISEPEKCKELKWFDINNLPSNIIPHVKRAIDNYLAGIFFTERNHPNTGRVNT